MRSGLLVAAGVAVALALGGCAGGVPSEDAAGEWRQWRGSGGRGVSNETNLAETWGPDSPNIRWKARIVGKGNSSPVVSQGRVFVTAAEGKRTETLVRVVLAVDLETGELLWRTPVYSGERGKRHYLNTHAAATPVTDGQSVFVVFDGHLTALDFDGNILWEKEIDPVYNDFAHYGVGSSPIVYEETVIVMQDQEVEEDIGWIAAFDKQTGEQLWRSEWDDRCCSYTTPVLADLGHGEELLVTAGKVVRGYDPATGGLLWEARHGTIQPVPSIVTSGNLIVAPGGVHSRTLAVFEHTKAGTEFDIRRVWKTRQMVSEISTPIVYRGALISVTRGGVLVAFDPATGEKLWTERLGPRGIYDPSLVAADGKVYATTRAGETQVVSVEGEKPELLSVNEIGEGTGATPAIAGGCLLFRGGRNLICIEAES